MKARGFTSIELIATVVVILILAAITVPKMFGGRDQAQHIRRADAAAALNAAEGAYYIFKTKTAPALSKTVPTLNTFKAQRILDLQTYGFLETSVDPADIIMNTSPDPPV